MHKSQGQDLLPGDISQRPRNAQGQLGAELCHRALFWSWNDQRAFSGCSPFQGHLSFQLWTQEVLGECWELLGHWQAGFRRPDHILDLRKKYLDISRGQPPNSPSKGLQCVLVVPLKEALPSAPRLAERLANAESLYSSLYLVFSPLPRFIHLSTDGTYVLVIIAPFPVPPLSLHPSDLGRLGTLPGLCRAGISTCPWTCLVWTVLLSVARLPFLPALVGTC